MHVEALKVALIIPTLNATKDDWTTVLEAIKKQSFQPEFKLILDSSSTDNTINIAEQYGYEIHPVEPGSFDHAGTRKWGISLVEHKADIIVFMTQDALLHSPSSLETLISSFNIPKVAIAYGRQLPRKGASPIETFGRIQNYPSTSETRSIENKTRLGMKTAFCSDSFAAYKIKLINEYDAFPSKSIIGEDSATVANMLLNGFKVHYNAEATVEHSHDYTIKQEFQRYFDTGVFHDEFSTLIKSFGAAEKAGASYVTAELQYLLKHKPSHIPLSIIRTASKYIGYKLGRKHKKFSTELNKLFSMHKFYFK